jgi:TatD DNase family protein
MQVPAIGIVDTHAHCYLESMQSTKEQWIDRIRQENIEKILLPNIDLDSIESMHQLCDEFSDLFLPMMGLHPCDVKENYEKDLETIKSFLYHNPKRYCGVGEIGLDYHWDLNYVEHQKKALCIQFEWAIDLKKSVSIHARKANQDVIPLISKYSKDGLTGVMHCFSGNIQEAKKIIDTGFYLGIGGVITYPKAGLAEVIREISLDHIVLETDAPFLPPVPHRGKPNEPSYLKHVVEFISELKGITKQEVIEKTTQNAYNCYQLADFNS